LVQPKKHLGQHFLRDERIASDIAHALTGHGGYGHVLEVGPGTGVLTKYLLERKDITLHAVEMDTESVDYLMAHYPQISGRLSTGDFLRMNLDTIGEGPLAIIGNFPYNISSQIFFKVLEHRDHIPEVVGMLQKEVAERLAAPPGSKTYGILSVLLQAWYDVEYLFSVPPAVFYPPPKVDSGVIRLKRNLRMELECDEKVFVQVVKAGFGQRRKTLRNALASIKFAVPPNEHLLTLRAERLNVEDFISIAKCVAH
jgi:16S rRNA (adenine1518-N6/adenine1519-N6)-dimethyltransferase